MAAVWVPQREVASEWPLAEAEMEAIGEDAVHALDQSKWAWPLEAASGSW
jgi:hypothetical protein